MLNLSDHSDKTLNDMEDTSVFTEQAYNTYGLQMETESFDFTDYKGDFIRYLKISLDTNKIDALVAQYGTNSVTENETSDLIPTLEAKDITSSSATLYPHVVSNDEKPVYCFVYRSTSRTENYEKINNNAINCKDGTGIIDDGLLSDTTYYYKAIVSNGKEFSDIIEVKTKFLTKEETTVTEEKVDSNPKTGPSLPVMIMIIVMSCGVLVLAYFRNRSILKQV